MSNRHGSGPAGSGRPRVVFLGMPCAFSAPPLAALLAAGVDVAAVVLPGPPGGQELRWHRPGRYGRPLPSVPTVSTVPGSSGHTPSLLAIADGAGVPLLFAATVRAERVAEEIRALRPDAVVVACFPERLPAALLDLAPLGALNLHPSLLPRDRGPSPIFWALHRGARETGVTVHLMDAAFDTGPILRQRSVPIPEGVRHDDLERTLAVAGADLLVEALLARAAGDRTALTQDATAATADPFPGPRDRVVDAETWAAERAFRFLRAVGSATVRLADGEVVPIVDAVRWEPSDAPRTPTALGPNGRWVDFRDGRVVVEVAPSGRVA